MDARETQKWLASKLKNHALIVAENKLVGTMTRARISELQYRKLLTMQNCKFGANKRAWRFVQDIIISGYRAMITDNQSDYIEILWHRYRKQHEYGLIDPYTEIIRFNQNLKVLPYDCNPENEAYTITFHDNFEDTFF